MKVIDPVCNMTIDTESAVATSTYNRTTYYFCSQSCKDDFDKTPEKFAGRETISMKEEKSQGAPVILNLLLTTMNIRAKHIFSAAGIVLRSSGKIQRSTCLKSFHME